MQMLQNGRGTARLERLKGEGYRDTVALESALSR